MAQTTETVSPKSPARQREPVEEVVEDVFTLPFEAQLGVLRTIVPKILSCLQGEQRKGFVRDLNEETRKAERGEPSYDVRTNIPTH
jgi:hypothetical protein